MSTFLEQAEDTSLQKKLPQAPPLYRVILLNDDFTPMDFVVSILEKIFHMGHDKALETMLLVHHSGSALCGVYPKDIAETKLKQVVAVARQYEYPLRCVMERNE